jgi:type II secretory pathway pseudopilin PulG
VSRHANPRGEDGFTLVEVIIAAAISIVFVLAIAGTVDKGILNSLGHQRQSSTLAIAQGEVEKIRQTVARYGFDTLAMSAQPGAPGATLPSSPSNPDDLLTGYGTGSVAYRIMENFHDTIGGVAAGTPTLGEPLIVSASLGRVVPSTTGVSSGTVTAKVYRYVTRRTEACTTAGACDGDSRRVVIAVVPTNNPSSALQTNKPFFFSTVIDNPIPQNVSGNVSGGLRIGVNIG